MSGPATLDAWLAHCERQHPKEIDLTLERVQAVHERLGFSFRAPVVLVAGTNGKGSTCAMLESIALAAGWRVGLYSKPHLCRFEERCRVRGVPVDPQALVPHLAAVEAARGAVSLTFFEHTTLAIMRLLAEQDLDLVILEVGLGGRLDAVNVIDADCAVITSVDIDHTEFLGNTREAIGAEKAGIMRAGRPVVIAEPSPPRSVIEAAPRVGAHVRRCDQHYRFTRGASQWDWHGWRGDRRGLPLPALRGHCQLQNAAAALAALETLHERLPVADVAIAEGLRRVSLPGRFQVIAGTPEWVLDVAHNAPSVRELARNLAGLAPVPATAAVFGCMQDKDLRAVLDIMVPHIDAWYLTDLPLRRAASAHRLREVLAGLATGRPEASCHPSPTAALQAVLERPVPIGRVVVFGSFHTVGGVLMAQAHRAAPTKAIA